MENTRPRYSLLDMARGITLLSMIAYHAAYDLTYLYHVRLPWFRDDPGQIWQQSICWTFIFLSGMCFCLGRHPVKRGLLLSGCGIIITLATALVMPDAIVIMGILSFFGLATLITALLNPLLSRIPALAGLPVSFLLFLLTKEAPYGYLGFEGLRLLELPRFLYRGNIMMVLGFPYDSFYSTDYFPLIPWIFLFFSGYFTWKLILWAVELRQQPAVLGQQAAARYAFSRNTSFGQSNPAPAVRLPLLEKPKCRPLEFLGKNTLPVYMLHQPVLMAVFTLIDLIGVL
ncbi:heparan-alpha-glucosaminide N-acetyltransferase [Eisenbergiella sp.]